MIITATSFYYDNSHSSEFNVTKISASSGLMEDSFMHSRNVNTQMNRDSRKSRVNTIIKEPLTLQVALYFDGNLNEGSMRKVKNWLTKESFKPLIFDDDDDTGSNYVFYAILDGEVKIRHNAVDSGYITFQMKTNSPYKFSPVKTVTGVSDSLETTISIYNNGDLPVLPRITLIMDNTPSSSIEIAIPRPEDSVLSKMIITGNLSNETVIVDSETELIKTSSTLRYVYDDHNGVYLYLHSGENNIKFKGRFSYSISYQEVYL